MRRLLPGLTNLLIPDAGPVLAEGQGCFPIPNNKKAR